MDTTDLEVMSCPPFDPAADVRITHTVQQGRTTGGDGDNHSRGTILNHYLRGPSVGKGQHGTVYKCWDLAQNSVEVAIKVVSRHNPRADRLNQLKRKRIPRSGPHLPVTDNLGSQEYKIKKEIAVMKLCRHPHVVRLLEVIDDKLYQKVYMVMEFLGGGEIKWRDSTSNPVLRVDQSRRICRDVILGLEYLHFQGIIHRDIKPANLMWTSDRRTVKITDFGVAHMSAAQRLAGPGRSKPGSAGAAGTTNSDADILLFEDSELCKTAGTPSFLAPEVVFDFGTEILPPSSSGALAASDSNSATTLQAPAPHRPPITKAIDVWALGVTLYCLLFGKTPFRVESNHEFALYGVICTQDWDVEPCMGLDRIPTEGRQHDCRNDKPCSEGAEIIKLLERLLEKDMSKRITLDEVKRHRWFLRDIPDRERWVRETLPNSKVVITITEDAISDAVSPMRFRWRQRLTNRLTSFLRTVRPQRSFRSADGHSDSDDVGVRSLPSIDMSRYNTEKDTSRRSARASNSRIAQSSGKTREKTLHTRGETHTLTASSSRRTRPVANISSSPRSKSSDTRTPGSSGGTQSNKSLQRRRGSASVLTGPERSAPSVHSLSPTTTTTPDDPRPRSRFSLSSLRWRRGETQPSTPASASATTSVPVTPPMSMSSSREPSRSTLPPLPGGVPTSPPAVISPVLAAPIDGDDDAVPAMRASSWGDVGEYRRLVRAPQEVASMHSGAGDHDEPLDLDVVVVGAGGFATGPLPPTPSNSAGALALVASGSGSGCAQPYGNNYTRDALCRRLPSSSSSAAAGPPLRSGSASASASRGSHGSGFGVVMVGGGGSSSSSRWHPHSHSRHANANAPHSIMQLSPSFGSGECQSDKGDVEGDGEGEGDPSDGDSDSFFARNSEEIVRPRVIIPNSIHDVFRHNDRGHEHQSYLQDEDDGDVDNGWGTYGARPSHRMDSHGKAVCGEEEEDDDDEDDDGSAGSGGERPIEVRRRQLAWADHDLEDDDDEDEEDEDEEDDRPPPTPP
ncbi:kinase-like domain-containing protein [Russula emetica]|nr:kinase-like domain-containing protein [Russula emetica]